MIFPVADSGVDLAVHDQRPQDGTPANDADAAAGAHPCVLVVEDNDDVRELAETVLAMHGYAVLAAASGEEALRLLEGGAHADLLFTDVVMPGGMTGLELVEKVGATHPQLPVLVTTGYMDDLPGSGKGLEILGKPYRHEDLLARVEAVLGKGS